MEESRREMTIRILRQEYGITSMEQLREAVRNMKKLDITQFVYSEKTGVVPKCEGAAM